MTVTSNRLRNKAVMTAGYFLAKRATSSWDKEPAYKQTVSVTMTMIMKTVTIATILILISILH